MAQIGYIYEHYFMKLENIEYIEIPIEEARKDFKSKQAQKNLDNLKEGARLFIKNTDNKWIDCVYYIEEKRFGYIGSYKI